MESEHAWPAPLFTVSNRAAVMPASRARRSGQGGFAVRRYDTRLAAHVLCLVAGIPGDLRPRPGRTAGAVAAWVRFGCISVAT
jgi:hypothetical protein